MGTKTEQRRAIVTEEHLEEARRLREIWDSTPNRGTQEQFGTRYDIGSQSAVGFFLNGKTPLSLKAAKGFARGLGVSVADFSPRLAKEIAEGADLVFQNGDRAAVAELKAREREYPYLQGFEQLQVPVLATKASMGAGADQMHDDVVVGHLTVSPKWVSKTIKPLTKPENLRFIHGYGDSMEPTFSDGDILLVDTGVRDCDVDGIYVLQANDRLFIKRVTERFDGVHEITSDNPKVKTVQALDGSQQVDVLGRVLWAWNGKRL